MLLRLRTPVGMFRFTVSDNDTFGDLRRQLVAKLPPSVDAQSIVISNTPTFEDSQKIANIARHKIGSIGLRYPCRDALRLSLSTGNPC